jgi:hypothetical protein
MGDSNSKNPNTQGKKVYDDYIIKQLNQDFVETKFPSEDETKVLDATNAFTKDMAKTDNVADATVKSSPEIEHLHTASKHSFKHEIDEGAIRRNEKMKLNQKVDDVASGNKKQEKSY